MQEDLLHKVYLQMCVLETETTCKNAQTHPDILHDQSKKKAKNESYFQWISYSYNTILHFNSTPKPLFSYREQRTCLYYLSLIIVFFTFTLPIHLVVKFFSPSLDFRQA